MTGLPHRGIVLYRSILRAHKKFLPTDMRQLGDRYVRSEFKAHAAATKEEHLQAFYQEWNNYLKQLDVTARARQSLHADGDAAEAANSVGLGGANVFAFGSDLPADIELSEDQVKQLEKLKEETDKLGSSSSP